jgi:BirA family biotin operon repressor/biotin-[acetyl-CoA-carboxylase] ligase
VLLAEKQTNGRGRKDRKWYSLDDQNLTFSILLKRKFKGNQVNIVNFSTSLAVAVTLENLFQLRVSLKWPNDVLVDGKKIAGILLDSVSKGSTIEKVVTGIGLNVNQSGFQGQYVIPPTSIKIEAPQEEQLDISRERLLSELLNNFEEIYLRGEERPQSVMDDWKQRCKMLGEKVTIEDTDVSLTGIFEDVDENGFLLLNVKDKIEKIHFGDVSLR